MLTHISHIKQRPAPDSSCPTNQANIADVCRKVESVIAQDSELAAFLPSQEERDHVQAYLATVSTLLVAVAL